MSLARRILSNGLPEKASKEEKACFAQAEDYLADKVYDDGVTKQAFRDATNINKIVERGIPREALSHLKEYGEMYGEFGDVDLLQLENTLIRSREIFMALPSELRGEFENSPAQFFDFVNRSENKDRLHEIYPMLAEPGRQTRNLNQDQVRELVVTAVKDSLERHPPGAGGEPDEPPSGGS